MISAGRLWARLLAAIGSRAAGTRRSAGRGRIATSWHLPRKRLSQSLGNLLVSQLRQCGWLIYEARDTTKDIRPRLRHSIGKTRRVVGVDHVIEAKRVGWIDRHQPYGCHGADRSHRSLRDRLGKTLCIGRTGLADRVGIGIGAFALAATFTRSAALTGRLGNWLHRLRDGIEVRQILIQVIGEVGGVIPQTVATRERLQQILNGDVGGRRQRR